MQVEHLVYSWHLISDDNNRGENDNNKEENDNGYDDYNTNYQKSSIATTFLNP